MTLSGLPARSAAAVRPPYSVALLINNPFLTDSRVWKVARTLGNAGYEVTVVARTAQDLPKQELADGFTVVRVAQPQPFARLRSPKLPEGEDHLPAAQPSGSLARTRAAATSSLGRGIQAARYVRLTRLWAEDIERRLGPIDVWQAEGLVALPVALELRRRRGGVAIYDARDLDVQSARFARLPGPWRRLLERRERSWARSVDAVVAASQPYADVLAENWDRTPTVIWNGPPDYTPPDPPVKRWHERLGLAPDTKVVLYLGLVMPGRGIEELCRAMAEVPDAVLVVAGFGLDYDRFAAEAQAMSHGDRIHFPGGVAPAEILDWIAAADVSAMPVQGDTVNHQLNTPTKLFDAMGAGVPVVASDLPGMAPIVRDSGCGELCDPNDPADIARAIRLILDASPERRAAYRDACLAAARGTYAWEHQAEVLLRLYEGLRVRA